MTSATFLLEGRLAGDRGLSRPVWHGAGAPAFTLSRTEDGAFDLRHRDLHLRSDPGLVQPGEAYRLVYRSNHNGKSGLQVQSLDRAGVACYSSTFVAGSGAGAATALTEDFLPADPALRAFSGLAAVANHNMPFADSIGVEEGAPILTQAGARPVESLVPGDVVVTDAGRRAVVQDVHVQEAVTLGSMNAVRLRAPYFGLEQDICVTRETQLMMSGPAIDYTFGSEAVTARAGDLINDISIQRDLSKPVRSLVTLELDRPGCLCIGRLRVGLGTSASDVQSVDRRGAQAILALAGDARGLID